MAKRPRTEPRRPNPVARTLAQPKFRRQVVQDKRRKPPRTPVRHQADAGVLSFRGVALRVSAGVVGDVAQDAGRLDHPFRRPLQRQANGVLGRSRRIDIRQGGFDP